MSCEKLDWQSDPWEREVTGTETLNAAGWSLKLSVGRDAFSKLGYKPKPIMGPFKVM